ncbi:MAG TPA: AAA domain-containing protein [Symbiobacteriaceae bacterium]|nr:AAA domain-containing protein [Symbiobacteriaceae bacterium]
MFQLSPSRVARYFFHECERHLRYFATPRDQRKQTGIPNPPFDHSPVTTAILEGGYVWETEVVSKLLKGRVRIAPGAPGAELRERTFDAKATIAALGALKPGEYLYQPTLVAPPGFYNRFGLDSGLLTFAACRPDLIVRVAGVDGVPQFRILDVKASDALKTSHKVQTALYSLLLEETLRAHRINGAVDLDQAGIWLYGATEPELFDLGVIRPHVETFLARELPRILVADSAEVPWHLNYRCEWCEYFEHCHAEAKENESVSLLPYLTTPGRRHLWTQGVHTLDEFAAFLKRSDAPAVLAQCASLSGREDRLKESVAALQAKTPRTFGGSSLAMPRGENVRLLLTLQREPVSGRIYASALLRTGNDNIFLGGQRHEEQFIADTPYACDEMRRTFVNRLYEILTELDEYNAGRPWEQQKSLQTYVFDSYEADLLRDILIESLQDEEVAEAALALLFYFHSEELIAADEHPAEETDFPVVVLTDVIRSLMALPVPVAYRLADVVATLPPEGREPFAYDAKDFYTFRLSNALRSDAIHGVWHHRKDEYVPRIRRELRMRLWAAWSVVDGVRAAAVSPTSGRSLLFAWQPKFRLPGPAAFRDPILSRLAFTTQYESLLTYLAVRAGRALPRGERERAGLSFALQALGGSRFLAEPAELAAELEPEYGRWLITEDTLDGEQAHLSFPDHAYRDKAWVPKNKTVLFASLDDVIVPEGAGTVVFDLDLKAGAASPAIVAGRRYLLTQAYMDWNSGRVIDRLLEIDDQGRAPRPARLLADPLGACRRLKVPAAVRTRAEALCRQAGFTESQADAFRHLLDRSLTLVWGPPGTGKTHFLAMSVLILLAAYRQANLPFRILVSAFTHAAIENCLQKLDTLQGAAGLGAEIVKLGQIKTQGCEHLEWIAPERAGRYLQEHQRCVVGGTTYAMLKAFKGDPEAAPFDLVVIDEGSQLRVPESLLAISRLAADGRLLVAGDDMQLPPIVQGAYPAPEPGEPLLHRSVFEALREPDRGREEITRQLYENFRMSEPLCRFPALHLYGDKYRSATPTVANQRLLLKPGRSKTEAWVERVLDPAYPWVLCILEGVQAGAENTVEAELVATVVRELRHRQGRAQEGTPYPAGTAGDAAFWRQGLFVVSPHHVQIRAIRRALAAKGLTPPFFVDTVDKMQGQECDTVIVSYGVSDAEYALQESEFIYSLNRLNVAVTRARRKCIVFLPRPLLTPTLQVLEQSEAAAGVAFMLALERHLVDVGERESFGLTAGQLVVCRAR